MEDLRSLVVPVRASASSAPEMSPEGGPVPYPSMGEVSSAMWCEYDDDSDRDSGEDSGDGGRRTSTVGRRAGEIFRHRRPSRLLRFSVLSLDGHVCDDEDEDSETDDGESGTDREDESDEDDGDDHRANSSRSMRWERRRRSNDPSHGSRARGAGGGTKGRRPPGARKTKEEKEEEEEFDEVDCQRKEELASVLRRLRVAIRRMDGAVTEEKVCVLGPPAARPPRVNAVIVWNEL